MFLNTTNIQEAHPIVIANQRNINHPIATKTSR